ncbi:efflux RND transporter periplasmic adaptor subunit [Marinobacter orientalis]|uniref:HlyD family efflux transporter periplasmic adaptor subunit n=1 Tax=Marinobacter orientalis TaxID=1928859 RepID=A0A7Y0WSX5_9GAMM|nr:HlyD family efflux transporter periplasmic adaptor subunit [Marinobacter orientalis]NMT64241.1 HlyD family efflux transporter periplasmic adaptor subunit [Marinobacter orientalis]TGX49464.1 HlyD family efflux transporter periplasmic adaptor subunit [Marinobacter orientalis]
MTEGKRITGKWLFWSALGVVAIVVVIYVLRPEPVWVDLATVQRGPMEITILEEGKSRVKDRYVVSSPVAGYLHRVELDVGDQVIPGELLTEVDPMPASALDARSRAEAEAKVEAARSALNSLRQKTQAAAADAELAKAEYQRLLNLDRSDFVSDERLQQAQSNAARTQAILRSARFDEEVAAHELTAARTRLEVSAARTEGEKPAERLAVRSPVNGSVLGMLRKSAGVIQAGEPILELGDPGALEVVVDVLSFDAVKLQPGVQTRLNGWGGTPLEAVVRRVEPVGFEDISALGVEEQRVRVIADMVTGRENWEMLGDGYRVDAEFILWQSADVLQVPASAVFQHDNGPAVFLAKDGQAVMQTVKTGRSNGLVTAVESGLAEGDEVVRHPGRELSDGDSIRFR